MLRRSLFVKKAAAGGGFLKTSTVLLSSSASLRNPNYSSSSYSDADRELEMRREEEQRLKATKGMMGFPKLDHSIYASYETSPGNFNSGGAGLEGGNNSNNTNSQSQSQGGSPFPFPTPFPFNFMNKNGAGSRNNNNSGPRGPQTVSDWLTFLTGVVLILYSYKLLTRGGASDSDGPLIPLWTANPILKARYLVFTVITTPSERDALKAEFAMAAKTMPFLSFFDWLDQKYPGWASGRKHPMQEHVFATLAQALGPEQTDPAQVPRLVAGIMQKRSGLLSLVGAGGGGGSISLAERQSLVDEMVDSIAAGAHTSSAGVVGSMFGFGNNNNSSNSNSGFAPPPPAPIGNFGAPFPPVSPQWGLPPTASAPYPPMNGGLYGGVNGGNMGGMSNIGQPNPIYAAPNNNNSDNNSISGGGSFAVIDNSISPVAGNSYYHQQPKPIELHGTQEVSLADITGGVGAIPQKKADGTA